MVMCTGKFSNQDDKLYIMDILQQMCAVLPMDQWHSRGHILGGGESPAPESCVFPV